MCIFYKNEHTCDVLKCVCVCGLDVNQHILKLTIEIANFLMSFSDHFLVLLYYFRTALLHMNAKCILTSKCYHILSCIYMVRWL
jgi:hypothetical protein